MRVSYKNLLILTVAGVVLLTLSSYQNIADKRNNMHTASSSRSFPMVSRPSVTRTQNASIHVQRLNSIKPSFHRFNRKENPKTMSKNTHFRPTSTNSVVPWSIRRTHQLANFYTQAKDLKPYRDAVIVYLHHNKAAGTSTKNCLSSIAGLKKRKLGTLLSSQGRMLVEKSKLGQTHRLRTAQIFMGGYSFGVCNILTHKHCSYFTILRDPYERLISSYSYCKRARRDQICSALGANGVSIKEWAKHQGSFLFRQLLFDPIFCTTHFLHNKTLSSLDGIPHSILGNDRLHAAPCWFRQKVVMHHALSDSQSNVLLKHCLDNLENWFAMIGLVEEYDASLMLLQDVYNVPFRECASKTGANKSNYLNLDLSNDTNIDLPADETIKQLKLQLQQDPEVVKALSADVKLYRKAKEIFHKQIRIYNERL